MRSRDGGREEEENTHICTYPGSHNAGKIGARSEEVGEEVREGISIDKPDDPPPTAAAAVALALATGIGNAAG